jgi:hypothetical protein
MDDEQVRDEHVGDDPGNRDGGLRKSKSGATGDVSASMVHTPTIDIPPLIWKQFRDASIGHKNNPAPEAQEGGTYNNLFHRGRFGCNDLCILSIKDHESGNPYTH